MSHQNLIPNARNVMCEPIICAQKDVLLRAIAKLVVIGEQVGITHDQMISLLQSGLTVRELLDYLAARERPVV